jgi:hypothetical protein
MKQIIEGVTSIKKEFDKALREFGVVEITPQLGEKVCGIFSFLFHFHFHFHFHLHFFSSQTHSSLTMSI